jgi:hypothetical protein
MKTTNTYRFCIFSPNQMVLFSNFLGKVCLAHGDHCTVLLEFHLVPCYKQILLIFFINLLLSNEVVFWQCAFVSKHTLHLPAYRIYGAPLQRPTLGYVPLFLELHLKDHMYARRDSHHPSHIHRRIHSTILKHCR